MNEFQRSRQTDDSCTDDRKVIIIVGRDFHFAFLAPRQWSLCHILWCRLKRLLRLAVAIEVALNIAIDLALDSTNDLAYSVPHRILYLEAEAILDFVERHAVVAWVFLARDVIHFAIRNELTDHFDQILLTEVLLRISDVKNVLRNRPRGSSQACNYRRCRVADMDIRTPKLFAVHTQRIILCEICGELVDRKSTRLNSSH